MPKTLQDLISATSELQSLPSTTVRLTELLDDATVDASRVLDIIEKDPSLTSNLLKLSNSAYYGLRRQVGSAREALVMLGNQTIVTLAFATSMGDILRGPLAAYRLARNDLWYHALGTGLGAVYLTSLDGDRTLRERAFTAGLVHDIGKLILNRPLKAKLEAIPADCDFETMMAAERSILGFDHAEAGAALAEAWNFPGALVAVIRNHHQPEAAEEDRDLVTAVAAANLVTARLGLGGGVGEPPDETYWSELESLGFVAETVQELMDRLPGDLENMLNLTGDSLK